MSGTPTTPVPCQPGYERYQCYAETNDWVTSLWGMLVVAIVLFVVFCPLMYRVTNTVFGGALASNNLVMGGASPNWKGWLLHVLVGTGVGYGLTLLFMTLLKKDPVTTKCEKSK